MIKQLQPHLLALFMEGIYISLSHANFGHIVPLPLSFVYIAFIFSRRQQSLKASSLSRVCVTIIMKIFIEFLLFRVMCVHIIGEW